MIKKFVYRQRFDLLLGKFVYEYTDVCTGYTSDRGWVLGQRIYVAEDFFDPIRRYYGSGYFTTKSREEWIDWLLEHLDEDRKVEMIFHFDEFLKI